MTHRSTFALATILAVAAVAAAPRPAGAASCPGGRFEIQGEPLLPPSGPIVDTDAVIIAGTNVSLSVGCDPVIGKLKETRKGTRVKARWRDCAALGGPVRLKARILSPGCETLTGRVKARKMGMRRPITAQKVTFPPPTPDATFDVIQQRIFNAHGCNVATCHGAVWAGHLDLRAGQSYLNLINVGAENEAARAAGKVRVKPGNAAASFLSQKLHRTLAAGEGDPMPLVGTALTTDELALIDAWIEAGAPVTGSVGPPVPPDDEYAPALPLPVPAPGEGWQIVFDGPTLQPGDEVEGCQWVRAPNDVDIYVGRWEMSLNPGTHHFAIWPYTKAGAPPLGVWNGRDIACQSGVPFGATSLAGAPQDGYYVSGGPPGVSYVLKARSYIGINPHYHNYWDVPIQVKIWMNVYPYAGTPAHTSQGITSLDTTFGISVPPHTQKIQHGRFVNSSGRPISILGVAGHMHKRGLRFTAWASDRTELYESHDFAHPSGRYFEPPMVLAPGDYVDYECLHDNGVTREVKRDAFGNPTTLTFGVTTDDEMCILVGTYYQD